MEMKDKNRLTEREFLEIYAQKDYPRPYLTADVVLFSENKGGVLLVKRKGHPFIGKWALPGGFANANESLADTALRELREETGIDSLSRSDIEEVGLFSNPGRDPRGWVVSEAYMAMVSQKEIAPKAGDDAAEAGWFTIVVDDHDGLILSRGDIRLYVNGEHSDLAFDHGEMLIAALKKFIYRRKEWIYA